jgi:aminomethyltransferase
MVNGEHIGKVTSGTFSPTLQKVIGMAYVPCQFSGEGTKLEINLRGTMVSAEVTGLPFYNRKS